ncbi:class II fructose-bisphosphate aldolase [Salinibacterium sp. SWN167]|uniref:class II fructose-bisphosphate aldolase n=1 Tax=Salinibacterium sp. SWN167 TaxID=2792054 RepID=UPI0018CEA0A5|nr:class II fructose-bisphosphate aldolase [Salinibacterium sp. SWN167]MBH0082667.1 class II fructose-bisphosphate aldolase family protein [Salinibacterium sp. SWN167]
MTLSSAGELVASAVEGNLAVPAFNVITLEQAEAIVAGAENAGIGVLLQISENAVHYHRQMEPLLAACREIAEASLVPIGIHLDHFESAELIEHALEVGSGLGVRSLMVDASKLEYSANVAFTASVADHAHALGWWVEAELGEIGGKDGAHAPGVRTDAVEARKFVAATNVDGLAVAVGSSHAMTERTAALDIDLIRAIAELLPVPLVLHGSSGVADDELRRAVEAGIRKVNIGTVLNLTATAALRAELARMPDAVDPRKFTALGSTQVTDLVAHLCSVV